MCAIQDEGERERERTTARRLVSRKFMKNSLSSAAVAVACKIDCTAQQQQQWKQRAHRWKKREIELYSGHKFLSFTPSSLQLREEER
jgi:hypothetical protein